MWNPSRQREEIERQKIKFGDKEKIVSLCKTYAKAMSGIWTPTGTLADILFERTV